MDQPRSPSCQTFPPMPAATSPVPGLPFLCLVAISWAGAATPAAAGGDAAGRAALEQRVLQLEAALLEVKAMLASTDESERRRSAAPGDSAPAAPTAGGCDERKEASLGASRLKVSGFVKLDAIASRYSSGETAGTPLGRDYYLPAAVPVGSRAREKRDFDAHAKQTRVALTLTTPVSDRTLVTHVETDFQGAPGSQGSERTTNGYNLALRRAFISDGRWTVGQDWSTFQFVAALPETADFIGPTEGTVFVRQAQVRRQFVLNDAFSLAVALENPETATITGGSPALTEHDDDSVPDLTARLGYRRGAAELSISGVARRLAVDDGGSETSAFGWGVSAAGKLPFGADHQHDVRFMLSAGSGIGRYIGLNLAPDAVRQGADGDLEPTGVLAGFAAVRLAWSKRLRSTLMSSLQDVDYHSGAVPGTANARAWSAALNLFYTPVPGLDLGAEYRHAERSTVNAEKGKLDRWQLVAKHSF